MKHSAKKEWILQRFTAVLIVLGVLTLIGLKQSFLSTKDISSILIAISTQSFLTLPIFDNMLAKTLLIIVLWAIFHHGYIGMKIIIEDYIHLISLRKAMIVTSLCCSYGVLIFAVVAILF